MTAYEGYVDECVQMLTQRLREMAEVESIVDMAKYIALPIQHDCILTRLGGSNSLLLM